MCTVLSFLNFMAVDAFHFFLRSGVNGVIFFVLFLGVRHSKDERYCRCWRNDMLTLLRGSTEKHALKFCVARGRLLKLHQVRFGGGSGWFVCVTVSIPSYSLILSPSALIQCLGQEYKHCIYLQVIENNENN